MQSQLYTTVKALGNKVTAKKIIGETLDHLDTELANFVEYFNIRRSTTVELLECSHCKTDQTYNLTNDHSDVRVTYCCNEKCKCKRVYDVKSIYYLEVKA